MKIYISADIEGVTGVTNPTETDKAHMDFEPFAIQMSKEVSAACEGAFETGAELIYVKDGHGSGRNIIGDYLPEYARLQRGWTGDPLKMVSGVDKTFDAALFIGYHSEATSPFNPLSHTISSAKVSYIKINGIFASEYLINMYACAFYNVPVVFLSGDKGLCEHAKNISPNITTVAVKEGIGDATINIQPKDAIFQIKSKVKEALSSNYKECKVLLPEDFTVEIGYNKHMVAYTNSFYPGASLISSKAIEFKTKDYYEVMRFLLFVI